MSHRFVLAIAGVLMCLAVAACARTEPSRVADHAERAAQILLAPEPTDAQMKEGFLALLDAVIEAAPQTGIPGEWPSKVAEARRLVAEGSAMNEKVVAILGECYRDVHGGAAFKMPPSIRTIDDAMSHVRRSLESVRGRMERGAAAEAVRGLLDASLVIFTPIEQGG